MKTQYINEESINCNFCNNNISIYDEKFYICSCKKIICPLCYEFHDKELKIIDYKKKFSFCFRHGIKFTSYCNTCFCNLCPECENDHKKHKIILYKSKMPTNKKINEINSDFQEFNETIKNYKK